MIRIANPKLALCALALTLGLAACDMNAHAPVSSAHAQPVPSSIVWPEVSPGAVADGNVEMY